MTKEKSEKDNANLTSDYTKCKSEGKTVKELVIINSEHEMNDLETAEEAENYVKSVMAQTLVKATTNNDSIPSSHPLQPLITPVRTGRKRHLSLPNINETNVKKVKSNSPIGEPEANNSNKERVTLKVRRSILPNRERLKTTKGRDRKVVNRNDRGNESQAKTNSKGDNPKKQRPARQSKEAKNKETVKQTTTEIEFNNTSDTFSQSKEDILSKWKSDFSNLYNQCNNPNKTDNHEEESTTPSMYTENDMLNRGISILDVCKAVQSLHKNKSSGYDNIPAEVLQSDTCVHFLHRLFSVCFETGKIPEAWEYGIITPLLKDSSADSRNPLNYRGITVTSAAYKAFCNVLNQRLTCWIESTDKLTDCQNGFREKHSTLEHLTTITSLIENRKAAKKSTFVAFVDFSKAYDIINRDTLWTNIKSYGINGKMFQALRSIYKNVKCAIKVKTILKQTGSVLSLA